MKYNPHNYQDFATNHILENPFCGLFLGMGLGKTAATATAFNELMYDRFEIRKPLIVAPLRVAHTVWSDEFEKWDHLQHLTLSKILGDERQRKEALLVKTDFYIINVDNLPWLVAHYGMAWPFDAVIIDESSKFKNHQAIRFKAMRSVRPLIKRVVELTGTPRPQSALDLWAPMYLLDQGERLEKTIGKYRSTYFVEGRRKGHVVYDYKVRQYYDELIYLSIGDICISMKAEDYLDLPERIENPIYITLPPKIKKQYDDFERKQVLALEDAEDISVVNAAALSTKLRQFANGAVYDEDQNWHEMHKEKLHELQEIVEVADGNPVLVLYSFKHDLERILQHLKTYKPRTIKVDKDIKDWNDKKIAVAVGHPASMGHGLNLQAGGNIIVWFGLPWSLELYQQATTRLDRQGQTERVINNKFICRGTIDEDIAAALDEKEEGQDALMTAVKARIQKYRTT